MLESARMEQNQMRLDLVKALQRVDAYFSFTSVCEARYGPVLETRHQLGFCILVGPAISGGANMLLYTHQCELDQPVPSGKISTHNQRMMLCLRRGRRARTKSSATCSSGMPKPRVYLRTIGSQPSPLRFLSSTTGRAIRSRIRRHSQS